MAKEVKRFTLAFDPYERLSVKKWAAEYDMSVGAFIRFVLNDYAKRQSLVSVTPKKVDQLELEF